MNCMITVINQPNYLPIGSYFEQIYRSDIFVIYDSVQYTKNDWRNRNRIRAQNCRRDWQWITTPVINKFGQKINEVEIDNHKDWMKKHLGTIEVNYCKAPYFETYWDDIKKIYSKKWELLIDLDTYIIFELCKMLGLYGKKFELASNLRIEGGDKTERLVEICQYLGADTYYSPRGSKIYLDTCHFRREGIKVEFQDYKHPIYPQLGEGFIDYMSVIDLLFNCGEKSLSILIGDTK